MISQENELKNLKRRNFELDNDLEKKVNIFNTMYEESKDLQIVNKSLIGKLKTNDKERKNFPPSIQLKRNSKNNISSGGLMRANHIDENFENMNTRHGNIQSIDSKEIEQLKEELIEQELIYKTKNKILKELKKRIKTRIAQLEMLSKDSKELEINKEILEKEIVNFEIKIKDEEIAKNKKKLEAKFKSQNLNKELAEILQKSGEIIKEKQKYDESVHLCRKEVVRINSNLSELNNTFLCTIKEIESSQDYYAKLLKEKYDQRNKIEFYHKFFEKYETFLKSLDSELFSIKSHLKRNKVELERIETDLNYKLYFIRFSNSFVRSFFNIINTRRLQIEMVKNLSKQEKEVYDFMFKKLDELESNLIKEYKEYLVLCDEDRDDISLQITEVKER